jgi:hypothetical protein
MQAVHLITCSSICMDHDTQMIYSVQPITFSLTDPDTLMISSVTPHRCGTTGRIQLKGFEMDLTRPLTLLNPIATRTMRVSWQFPNQRTDAEPAEEVHGSASYPPRLAGAGWAEGQYLPQVHLTAPLHHKITVTVTVTWFRNCLNTP